MNVILPLALQDTYTYRIPLKFKRKIYPGQRVIVQFGRKKFFSALVLEITDNPPSGIEFKEIVQVLDDKPLLFPENFKLWKWMAEYYCCSLGEIFRAALPSGFILESRSKVIFAGKGEEYTLSKEEYMIIDLIGEKILSIDNLQKKAGKDFSFRTLNSLIEKNIIRIEERIVNKYKPKTSARLKLNSKIGSKEELNSLIENLKRSKKQQSLLLHFCEKTVPSISKKELLEETGISGGVLKALIRKGIFVEFQEEVSRLDTGVEDEYVEINSLNGDQPEIIKEVRSGFEQNRVVLIHGDTAGGKAGIYISLISETVRSGRQVLFLVSEIDFTSYFVGQLKTVFGRRAGIYHSRFSSHERVEIWQEVLKFRPGISENYQIVLGTRSSVFLPFSRLGLIIVDQEHENSFKQHDPAPRYNARDMAIILGNQQNANILLGSATPSYESYFNALSGKYKLVNLLTKNPEIKSPEIIVADVRTALKKKQMKSILSPELFLLMKEAFENNRQVILFQNRRGYSSLIQCFDCGWIPKCINCDVTLTYHKSDNRLKCHYCGYITSMPQECLHCGSGAVKTYGFGTEKIEEELQLLFPEIKTGRVDYDTAGTKKSYSGIIDDFRKGKIDLLVGTQMVIKVLGFENVSVAGIINADDLINFPDFRAYEKAYQLISQICAGMERKQDRGTVVLQTSQPNHPVVSHIREQDFLSLFKMQMEERKLFKYPPYSRLIKITVRHKRPETVSRAARQLALLLKERYSFIILGPAYPLVNRIQSLFLNEIWIKAEPKKSLQKAKQIIMQSVTENSNCAVVIDVDPA